MDDQVSGQARSRFLDPLGWAVLAAGAVLPLLRVLPSPLHTVVGLPYSDVQKHVWAFWHVLQTVAQGTWPWSFLVKAPCGGVLVDPMAVPAVLLAPVTALAGPALADNLWVALSLFAVALATAALTRELGGSRLAAAIAGGLAPSSPFLLGYPLASGVRERLAVWVFPLLVLAVLRLLRRPAPWSALLAVAGLALAALGAQFYGFLAALLVPLVVAAGSLRRPGWRALLRVAAFLAALAAVLAGVYLLTTWARAHPWSLVTSSSPSEGQASSYAFRTEWLGLLLDPLRAHRGEARLLNDTLLQVSYLGWVPLLAALLPLCLRTREPVERAADRFGSALLLALIAFFAALAVGPVIGRTGLTNPVFALVGRIAPFSGHAERAWQDVAVVGPLLVAAAARALDRLPPGRIRGAAAALGALAVLAERAVALPVLLAPGAADLRVSPLYDAIGAAEGAGAVLDAPRFLGTTEVSPGEPFLAQVRHQRPIPWGINPDRQHPVARLELSPAVGRCTREGWLGWGAVAPELAGATVRWVVLHPGWCSDVAVIDEWVEDARAAFGEPWAEDAQIIVFDLGPDAADSPDPCLAPPERTDP
jgi:hypothetical protein